MGLEIAECQEHMNTSCRLRNGRPSGESDTVTENHLTCLKALHILRLLHTGEQVCCPMFSRHAANFLLDVVNSKKLNIFPRNHSPRKREKDTDRERERHR